jgi:hypothetical protein
LRLPSQFSLKHITNEQVKNNCSPAARLGANLAVEVWFYGARHLNQRVTQKSKAKPMKRTLAAAAALLTTFCASSVLADSYAYVGENNDDIGTLDLNTGAFTKLGNPGVLLTGMAGQNGTLYGASFDAGNLYTINTANGALTLVGNSGVPYEVFGSAAGRMYAVGQDLNLYSISPITGAATLIGPALYYSEGANLYRVNTTTGAGALVGDMGGPEIGGMVYEGGVLYGGEDEPGVQVDELNPLTGAATVGPLADMTGNFWALGPDPLPNSVPDETSTLGLLAAVGLGCCLARRRTVTIGA